MAKTTVTLVWIQREFRLSHLPALQAALARPGRVIVAYFHDPKQTIGAANNAWLAQSLLSLQADLTAQGAALWMVEGDFAAQLSTLITAHNVKHLHYSYQVGLPFSALQEQALAVCQACKVALTPFYSEFWFNPSDFFNKQQKPYLVFTPFYKALMEKQTLLEPLDAFNHNDFSAERCLPAPPQHSALPSDLAHLLQTPWAQKVLSHWNQHAISEAGAWQALDDFIEHRLTDYPHDRDFMAIAASSQLSPYLQFGQLCARMVYFYLEEYKAQPNRTSAQIESAQAWLRQLVWKEFARHLLFWFANTQHQPFMLKYQSMPWQTANQETQAWQKGLTGYPLIDAGMRELWATGIMHNRVRMLVASFLTKNLNQHWLIGKAWFDQTLLDADPANNVMGWQWVAGCGVDASPYYRLFNPITQSEKFDAKGDYIRAWVPELKSLSSKAIHAPWLNAAECTLKGITLGKTYPLPLVDLKTSRDAHMARVQSLKGPLWISENGASERL